MNRYLDTNNPKDCCGCSACVQICPKHCLVMSHDKDGFLFPTIISENCINCGLCARVCPMETKVKPPYEQKYYGAYTQDAHDILASSSGGIYPTLAKWVLSQNGIVYGATLDSKRNLYHIGAHSKNEVDRTIGSKYFQSDIRDTFKECQSDLEEGKIVLFTGTPCQIHGLKCFLKKDYEKLYTADVICHGVPSQKIFNAYVQYLENKHHAKLVDINFRDKKRNGWSITLRYTMEFANGKQKDYYLISKLSEYFMAFLSGSIARESCYICPFSSLNRPGDITLGDFWGYQRKRPDLKHEEGLSLILCNSMKGKYLIDVLQRRNVVINEVDEACVKASENKNLYNPTTRPELRNKIYEELEKEGFEYIASKYFRYTHTLRNKIKNYLPSSVVKLFQK